MLLALLATVLTFTQAIKPTTRPYEKYIGIQVFVDPEWGEVVHASVEWSIEGYADFGGLRGSVVAYRGEDMWKPLDEANLDLAWIYAPLALWVREENPAGEGLGTIHITGGWITAHFSAATPEPLPAPEGGIVGMMALAYLALWRIR